MTGPASSIPTSSPARPRPVWRPLALLASGVAARPRPRRIPGGRAGAIGSSTRSGTTRAPSSSGAAESGRLNLCQSGQG
eukprot:11199286-Lingulodinium_polyedra.AAC.1